MKKSLIAAALALAGAASHATTVSDLTIPSVGTISGALVPYGAGVTQKQWVLSPTSSDLEIVFNFSAKDTLVFALDQSGTSSLFSAGTLGNLTTPIQGVMLAYSAATGGAGAIGGVGGSTESVEDLRDRLSNSAGAFYSASSPTETLQGRIALSVSTAGPQTFTIFELQLKAPGTSFYDTLASTTLSYATPLAGVDLFSGGRVGFASFQQSATGPVLALNGVPSAVPESSAAAMALAGLGVVGLCMSRRRTQRG